MHPNLFSTVLLLLLLTTLTTCNPLPVPLLEPTDNTTLTKRGPGIYVCSQPNWQGYCASIPPRAANDNGCWPMPYPASLHISFGPDPGIRCWIADECRFPASARYIEHPGVADLFVNAKPLGARWHKCHLK